MYMEKRHYTYVFVFSQKNITYWSWKGLEPLVSIPEMIITSLRLRKIQSYTRLAKTLTLIKPDIQILAILWIFLISPWKDTCLREEKPLTNTFTLII